MDKHRPSAIMFTDIVGYTRKMAEKSGMKGAIQRFGDLLARLRNE